MSKKASISQIFFIFVIYTFIALAVHEYGYLIALRLLGLEGAISSNALNVVRWFDTSSSLVYRFIVGISGGLATVLVLGTLYYFDIDRENKFTYRLWVGNNAIYCLFEAYGTMQREYFYLGLGMNIAYLYMAALILYHLLSGWFRK